jgi:hypothetical protein
LRRVIRATALDRLKNTYRGTGLLLPQIERHVMRSIKENPERSANMMHPSDMCKADWCGRHDYYRIIDTPVDKVSQANPSFRMQNVFAEGHAIHGKYQDWLYEMGVLVGMFRCRECGHRWYAKSPAECQFCRSERVSYMELPLHQTRYMVEGHADAGVHLAKERTLVEIKSIGIRTLAFEAPRLYNRYLDGDKAEDIWRDITHPFGTHMRQGQLYLWMVWPAYEQITFIYEAKFTQQVKEFVVGYNKNLIAPILETAKEVSQGVRAGVAPDRPLWADDPEGKVCHSCVYRSTCWQLGSTHGTTPQSSTPTPVRRAKPAARKRALREAAVRRTGTA